MYHLSPEEPHVYSHFREEEDKTISLVLTVFFLVAGLMTLITLTAPLWIGQ